MRTSPDSFNPFAVAKESKKTRIETVFENVGTRIVGTVAKGSKKTRIETYQGWRLAGGQADSCKGV